MARVSIIVPYHNTAPQYMRPLLDSIMKQVYRDFDLTLVDDGSTNKDTVTFVQEYIKEQKLTNKFEIKYIRVEVNKGVGNARNVGFDNTTGEIICYIDSDDILNELFIQNIVDKFDEKPQAEIVCTAWMKMVPNANLYLGERQLLYKPNPTNMDEYPETILDIVCPATKGFKREFLVKNKIRWLESNSLEDLAYWVTCCSRAKHVYLQEQYTYYIYRIHPSSTSNSGIGISKARLAFETVKKLWEDIKNDDSYISNRWKSKYFNVMFVNSRLNNLFFANKKPEEQEEIKRDPRFINLVQEIKDYYNALPESKYNN